ncbi:hypothetical protein [uncultured Rubinisphaera sp.]|uniref:hypothetical protein n=1 Tax=uncultured Rubinisphaera sp. TaxID=1678686 RepID=UPI0030DB36B9
MKFEDDPDVIVIAADQRMAFVQKMAIGKHLEHSQKLLNELARARLVLVDPQKKEVYDASLIQISDQPTNPSRRRVKKIVSSKKNGKQQRLKTKKLVVESPTVSEPNVQNRLMNWGRSPSGISILLLLCLLATSWLVRGAVLNIEDDNSEELNVSVLVSNDTLPNRNNISKAISQSNQEQLDQENSVATKADDQALSRNIPHSDNSSPMPHDDQQTSTSSSKDMPNINQRQDPELEMVAQLKADSGRTILAQTTQISGLEKYSDTISVLKNSPGSSGNSFSSEIKGVPVRYISVRGVFDLRKQILNYSKALNISESEAENLVQFMDFKLERQMSESSSGPWGKWEPVDIQVAMDYLNQTIDFDRDVVSSGVRNPVITMPLPARLIGIWRNKISHPSIKPYESSSIQTNLGLDDLAASQNIPMEIEYEDAVNRKILKELDTNQKLINQSTVSGGFQRVQFNFQSLQKEYLQKAETDELDRFFENEFKESSAEIRNEQIQKLKEKFLTPTNLLLFRYIDFGIEDGKAYRYRVSLVLSNPNYDVSIDQVVDPSLAQGAVRDTPYSEPSDVAVVSPDYAYFVRKVSPPRGISDDLVEMQVYQWYDSGTMVKGNLSMQPGDFIEGSTTTHVLRPTDLTFEEEEDVEFVTEELIVDAHVGHRVNDFLHKDLMLPKTLARGNIGIVPEVLVVDSSGNLKTLNPIAYEGNRVRYSEYYEAEKEPFESFKDASKKTRTSRKLDALLLGKTEDEFIEKDLVDTKLGLYRLHGRRRNPIRRYPHLENHVIPFSLKQNMEKDITLNFSNMSLGNALKMIADEADVEIDIDREVLVAAGALNSPVQNLQLTNTTALSAIHQLIKEYEDLCVILDDSANLVRVTSISNANSNGWTPHVFKPEMSTDNKGNISSTTSNEANRAHPHFDIIWRLGSSQSETNAKANLTLPEAKLWINREIARKRRPVCITPYLGPDQTLLFAFVSKETSQEFSVDLEIRSERFQSVFDQHVDMKYMPIWVADYRNGKSDFITAVWIKGSNLWLHRSNTVFPTALLQVKQFEDEGYSVLRFSAGNDQGSVRLLMMKVVSETQLHHSLQKHEVEQLLAQSNQKRPLWIESRWQLSNGSDLRLYDVVLQNTYEPKDWRVELNISPDEFDDKQKVMRRTNYYPELLNAR